MQHINTWHPVLKSVYEKSQSVMGGKLFSSFLHPQKTYNAMSPEPQPQFSQTGLHFLQNHKMNPIKLWNLKTFHDIMVWGLRNWIWVIWVQKMHQGQNPSSNFHKQEDPIFPLNQIKPSNLKKILDFVWMEPRNIDFTWVLKFYQAKSPKP